MTSEPRERRTPTLAVVLPVYNEADSISAVLGEVNEAARRLEAEGMTTVVILVDDNSPDGTGDVAQVFADRTNLDLQVVAGSREGLGTAMLRGLAAALQRDPDAIVALDGDGQHNPSDIPTLYRAFVARNADIVIGSRWARGGRAPGISLGRALGSRLGNFVFRAVTGTRGVADATTSFRVYSPRVVEFLLRTDSSRYSGYSFFSTTIALAEAAGYTISEVPIEFRPRYSGMSKLNRREVWRYFSSLGALRRERRHQVVGDGSSEYLATQEMEWLDQAKAWNEYVVSSTMSDVEPASVRRVAEVGAGVGAVSAQLLQRFPDAEIFSFEPDTKNFERLSSRFAEEPRLHAMKSGLTESATVDDAGSFDLVVYTNVLEHVQHDAEELKLCYRRLTNGGQLAIFVPALPSLYGPIDARSGHFRRYSPESLRTLLELAGFTTERIGYVDRLGIVPYWLNYRLLNKAGMPTASAAVFDRGYVPLTRFVDRCATWLPDGFDFGKNLVCVATKDNGAA
jgi:dolichol-phosphate mannosyltransferase